VAAKKGEKGDTQNPDLSQEIFSGIASQGGKKGGKNGGVFNLGGALSGTTKTRPLLVGVAPRFSERKRPGGDTKKFCHGPGKKMHSSPELYRRGGLEWCGEGML